MYQDPFHKPPSRSIDSSSDSDTYGSTRDHHLDRYLEQTPPGKGLHMSKPLPAYVPTHSKQKDPEFIDERIHAQPEERVTARESSKPQFQTYLRDPVAKAEAAATVLHIRGKRRVKIQKWQIAAGLVSIK